MPGIEPFSRLAGNIRGPQQVAEPSTATQWREKYYAVQLGITSLQYQFSLSSKVVSSRKAGGIGIETRHIFRLTHE